MHSPEEPTKLRALDDADLARRIMVAATVPDELAEGELCRRLAPRVRLYGLRHLRSAAAAADLVQDVLLMTLQKLRAGSVREPERLASFVLGMSRQMVIDQRRGQGRRERLLNTFAGAVSIAEPSGGPPLDIERLQQCLEHLAERERAVVVMSFYDDSPAADVAHVLGLSAGNVRVIRHRSLERLRACMGADDVSSEGES